MFFKIDVFKNFAIFTGIHRCWSIFLIKLQEACNFIKKKLPHRWFSVNIAKFLRTPFYKEHLWWLLLNVELVWMVYVFGKTKTSVKSGRIRSFLVRIFPHLDRIRRELRIRALPRSARTNGLRDRRQISTLILSEFKRIN